MTILKTMLRSCVRTAALTLLPVAAAHSQDFDNAAAYALANQVADELELVRERMGRPFDDSPRLPVSAVSELELYFQTQSLLRKANQLAQELAGAAPRSPGPEPSGEIEPGDVYALLDDSLAQIRVRRRGDRHHRARHVRAARHEHRGDGRVPRRHRHQPPVEPDAARADRRRGGVRGSLLGDHVLRRRCWRRIPARRRCREPPPFDGYKRPADVYQRLTECMDAVIRVAPKVGVPVLGLSARRNVPDDTEPGHAYDIARFLVADLAALADARDVPRVRVSLPAPKHIFPTEVYAHAGILLRQLEQLEQRL